MKIYMKAIIFGISIPFGLFVANMGFEGLFYKSVYCKICSVIIGSIFIFLGLWIPWKIWKTKIKSLNISDIEINELKINKEKNDDKYIYKMQKKFFYSSIIFGITLPISFYILVTFSEILDFVPLANTFLKTFAERAILVIFRWIAIFISISIPWFIWQKFIHPYKSD